MQTKFISITKNRRASIYGPFTWFSAAKDGGPILREEGTWRDINGFMIQGRGVRIIVTFRRFGSDG